MRRAAFALLAFVALTTLGAAQTPLVPTPEIAADPGRKDAFPTVEVAFPGGGRVLPEARYWTPVGFRPQTMDVYLPPNSLAVPAGGFPTVMYIHGGGWMAGNSHSIVPLLISQA